jgi:23S rRNA pseudouridine1911/1915/1917 synthase
MKPESLSARVPDELAGQRIDQALAAMFPEHTRSQLQQWIAAGRVRLDGTTPRKRDKVRGGAAVEVDVPAPEPLKFAAEKIPLKIVYEDRDILVINKPAGLVVHPGAGNPRGTLLNALLHHAPKLKTLPRAGIVHRLDKDTSGLLVVARNEKARRNLIEQLKERRVTREYLALVNGVMISGATVDAPIGRHRVDRTRMTVTESGREAVSHVRVVTRYTAHTLVQVALESGRTHQIRVHLAHLKFPIVGDPTYGGRLRIPAGASERLKETLRGFRRQALHAAKLELVHPNTGELLQWSAPPPADMAALLDALASASRSSVRPLRRRD